MQALSSPESGKSFMDAFQAAQRDVVIPVAKRSKEHYEGCQAVYDYIDARIDEAVSRTVETRGEQLSTTRHVRIIDELVKTSTDKLSLRYLIISIFMPAHDNVAVALSNAFFHLARNPDCWTKLRAEINSKAQQPLTYELLASFKYMEWVLRESEFDRRVLKVSSGVQS